MEAESLVEAVVQEDVLSRLLEPGNREKGEDVAGPSPEPLALIDFSEQISF